jgi:hypothetical protein
MSEFVVRDAPCHNGQTILQYSVLKNVHKVHMEWTTRIQTQAKNSEFAKLNVLLPNSPEMAIICVLSIVDKIYGAKQLAEDV